MAWETGLDGDSGSPAQARRLKTIETSVAPEVASLPKRPARAAIQQPADGTTAEAIGDFLPL
jgi:hypothetical protein